MVSVDHRPFENFLSNHSGIGRLFPSRLYSSFNSAFDDDEQDIFMNKDGPTFLESVFPSLYQGIISNRNYRHNIEKPLTIFDRDTQLHQSSDVTVIPIKVEYLPEKYKWNESSQPSKSKMMDVPIDLNDDFLCLPSNSCSTNRQNIFNKVIDPEWIQDPVTIAEDAFFNFDSRQTSQKSEKQCVHQLNRDAWKSVPVEHLKSLSFTENGNKLNSNNNSPRRRKISRSSRDRHSRPDDRPHTKLNTPRKMEDKMPAKTSAVKPHDESIISNTQSNNCTSSNHESPQHVNNEPEKTAGSHDPSDILSLLAENFQPEFEQHDIIDPPNYTVYRKLRSKLKNENRIIDYIEGDGNCFFRALSKTLYGTERYHSAMRVFIVHLIASNESKFAQFVDHEDIELHVQRMSEDQCWATTCEIYAAATLLQLDVYMMTPDHRNKDYSWLLFTPLFKIKEPLFRLPQYDCYITLCNTSGIHYDLVLPDHGGCNCFLPKPQLSEEELECEE